MTDRPGTTRTATGVVVEQLPSALFRVRLDGNQDVLAHIGGGMRRNFVRILVGDRVRLELARADVTRGRITQRLPRR